MVLTTKTIKHNTTYTRNKRETEKTALANKTIYTLIWYAFYDLRSGNGVGSILTAPQPTRGIGGKRREGAFGREEAGGEEGKVS